MKVYVLSVEGNTDFYHTVIGVFVYLELAEEAQRNLEDNDIAEGHRVYGRPVDGADREHGGDWTRDYTITEFEVDLLHPDSTLPRQSARGNDATVGAGDAPIVGPASIDVGGVGWLSDFDSRYRQGIG